MSEHPESTDPAHPAQGSQPQEQPPGQQPYGQPGYGPPPYGPSVYGPPYGPGYGPYGYGPYPGMEQKSRLIAGLLGILLGSLGIHRFYLGYTTIGVVQIVVTFVTLGIGGVWGFIEGIMILVGADPFRRDANGIPLKE